MSAYSKRVESRLTFWATRSHPGIGASNADVLAAVGEIERLREVLRYVLTRKGVPFAITAKCRAALPPKRAARDRSKR